MEEVIDDGGELLFCLLMEVRDRNTSGEDSIIGVSDGHVCSRLCCLYKQSAINEVPRVLLGLPDYPAQ